MALGIGIGISGLRLRKGAPRADADRTEAGGRIERGQRRPDPAAEGDRERYGYENGTRNSLFKALSIRF